MESLNLFYDMPANVVYGQHFVTFKNLLQYPKETIQLFDTFQHRGTIYQVSEVNLPSKTIIAFDPILKNFSRFALDANGMFPDACLIEKNPTSREELLLFNKLNIGNRFMQRYYVHRFRYIKELPVTAQVYVTDEQDDNKKKWIGIVHDGPVIRVYPRLPTLDYVTVDRRWNRVDATV